MSYDFIFEEERNFVSRSVDYILNKLLFEFYIYDAWFGHMTYLQMLYNESMQEYYMVFTYFCNGEEQKFMIVVDQNEGNLIEKTIKGLRLSKEVKMAEGLDGFTVGFIFKEERIYEWWCICPREWRRLIKVVNILLEYLPNDIRDYYEGRID